MKFYKYAHWVGQQGEYTRQNLLESAVYLSSPVACNDPFDCNPVYDYAATYDAKKKHFAKLQMFFFTMVALITYSITIFIQISKNPIIASFPALSEGFLIILGIGYGGYVSSKTIINTK